MPSQDRDRKVFSLKEVMVSIRNTVLGRYSSAFWVKAEMNKLNYYPHSGHCYPDLVEKAGGKVIAQIKSTLWKDDYVRVNQNFLDVLKTPLQDGIMMLFCARITFDPVHGLALRIVDIDPVFSLGELEREKQETLAKLKEENIFGANKALKLPLLPQRIAIISVQTSKGYADFLKMVDENPWHYRFFHMLFPSLLQGDHAVESILVQLSRIRKVIAHFDAVAIIRGGGGEVGLSCFNNYALARAVALFPVPVITGIGHATNETVVEMVAFKNAITPTELADYLLQKFHQFSLPVQRAQEKLVERTRRLISEERLAMRNAVRYFRSVTGHVLVRYNHFLREEVTDLTRQVLQMFSRQRQAHTFIRYNIQGKASAYCQIHHQDLKHHTTTLRRNTMTRLRSARVEVEAVVKSILNMHPENVLKRGYSITRVNGKAVTRVGSVRPGDIMHTVVADGSIFSEIQSVNKTEE